MADGLRALDLIEAKKGGAAHSAAELGALVSAYLRGDVPDYQMAAWLMAVRWQGLSAAETHSFTDALVASGEVLDLAGAGIAEPTIDKHSTGGVGDKLSLIVVPLLIAAGAAVLKLSGAGLGHTGGTVDKLLAIPGLRVEFANSELLAITRRAGGCMAAQSPSLVPADGAIYALRDATGTVDSIPLIAASVMAKKIACGASVIGLDVKVGRGAFTRTRSAALELARLMVDIASRSGRRATAVLTAMDQPLGMAVGNAIEVNEAVAVLKGGGPADVHDLALELASHSLAAAGGDAAPASRRRLAALLAGGQAFECFARVVSAQGAAGGWLSDVPAPAPRMPAASAGPLPLAAHERVVAASRTGVVAAVDALSIGRAAVALGAGRAKKGDVVDPGAGVELLVRSGDAVAAGQPLARLYAADPGRFAAAERLVSGGVVWCDESAAGGRATAYLAPGQVIEHVVTAGER